MPIYLIRHTTPLINKGVCYGHADLDVIDSFEEEAAIIRKNITDEIQAVHSSPLMRCRKLAEHLFPSSKIEFHNDLREIHCGEWEMKSWDEIPRHEVDPWMEDFVNVIIPGGESYLQLYERVSKRFEEIAAAPHPTAIVTHGGVIRSILAHITGTPLADSFKLFKMHYGCVVKLHRHDNVFHPEILCNIELVREQHKPAAR